MKVKSICQLANITIGRWFIKTWTRYKSVLLEHFFVAAYILILIISLILVEWLLISAITH